MSWIASGANAAWCLANLPAWAAFEAALAHPRRVQEQLLRRYLTRNIGTAFARDHGFARIDSVDAFQRRVPIRNYDALAPYIDRIAAGETNVLTADRVTRLATSSGSTRAAKLIPYTAELQREFNRAIGPWITDLFRGDPSLAGGCAYWSISPVARQPSERTTAIPVGFEEDSAYLGGFRKRLVDAVMAVPGAVRHCADVETFRYTALRFLLARGDLRVMSVWHPSFLSLLLAGAVTHWDRLVADIAAGTLTPPSPLEPPLARQLGQTLRPDPSRAVELQRCGPGPWTKIWPRLGHISTWASGHAAGPAKALMLDFPRVRLVPKGLLATEAFVTIPFRNRWPLAVRSHFFEFIDDRGHARLANELVDGAEYEVIVTTGGGLWRYRLGDRVRVTGWVGQTPSLEYIGRQDHVIDRFGEKLSEGFVAQAIAEATAGMPNPPVFAMLAPDDGDAPGYTLFIEAHPAPPLDLPPRLDAALRRNPHYAYCRDLGQLAPLRVFRIAENAYPVYVQSLASFGQRLGDVKPAALTGINGWARRFLGDYV